MLARILRRCLPLLNWLFQAVQRNAEPRQIAGAIALGTILGLMPKANFAAAIFLLILLRWPLNRTALLASTVAFSAIGWGCEPFLHRAGFLVLTWKPLVPVWTWLYNLPLLPWTSFNNTLVMGGISAGLYLCLPLYLLTNLLIERYQSAILAWLNHLSWAALLRSPHPAPDGGNS